MTTTTKEALEPPDRIRLVKRQGIFDGQWYYPDAAIMPFEAEFQYRRVSAPIVDRIVERCADCGHSEGTDANGRCRFMYVASDPSQMVDTSPSNQCSHYCPRTIGERIARKHLPFTDYDEPLSKAGQQLAADIDLAIRQVHEQSIGYTRALTGETLGGI